MIQCLDMPTSEELFVLDLLTDQGWLPHRGDIGWYLGEAWKVEGKVEVVDVDYLGGYLQIVPLNEQGQRLWDKTTYRIFILPEEFSYKEPVLPEDYL